MSRSRRNEFLQVLWNSDDVHSLANQIGQWLTDAHPSKDRLEEVVRFVEQWVSPSSQAKELFIATAVYLKATNSPALSWFVAYLLTEDTP